MICTWSINNNIYFLLILTMNIEHHQQQPFQRFLHIAIKIRKQQEQTFTLTQVNKTYFPIFIFLLLLHTSSSFEHIAYQMKNIICTFAKIIQLIRCETWFQISMYFGVQQSCTWANDTWNTIDRFSSLFAFETTIHRGCCDSLSKANILSQTQSQKLVSRF